MNKDKPETAAVLDGRTPPTPELEDASQATGEDIALSTPLEPGDGNAQPV